MSSEMPVLLFAEREPVEVRAPHQALDHHSSPRRVREDPRDLGSRAVQELVGISAPIGEQQQVAGPEGLHASKQFSEVLLAVNQRRDLVVDRERPTAGVSTAQQGGRVAPLCRADQPLVDGHGDIQPRPVVNGMSQAIGPTSWPDPTARHAIAAAIPDSLPQPIRGRPEGPSSLASAAPDPLSEIHVHCPGKTWSGQGAVAHAVVVSPGRRASDHHLRRGPQVRRHYAVPLAFTRHDGVLLVGTPFGWGRNLRTGEAVD